MRTKSVSYFVATLLFLLIVTGNVFAQSKFPEKYTPVREYSGQTIWDILTVSEENLDIGLWALIIAKEYDSNVDVKKHLKELDAMVTEINRMIANRNTDMAKFVMAKTFLYDSGKWNDHKPFRYNLEDPLGEKTETQLLSNYMTTRKGNCVSMPTLFLALMERIDPNVPFTGVRAPLHLFCRFKDRQSGDIWNVEASNGGHPARNQWYIETLSIPQTAVEYGVFLADMSKKEFLADLIQPLIFKFRFEKNYKQAIKYADLSLQLNPHAIYSIIQKGALLDHISSEIEEQANKEERKMTVAEKEKVTFYQEKSQLYIKKAYAVGWRPETKEQQDAYLETIRNRKEQQTSNTQ